MLNIKKYQTAITEILEEYAAYFKEPDLDTPARHPCSQKKAQRSVKSPDLIVSISSSSDDYLTNIQPYKQY